MSTLFSVNDQSPLAFPMPLTEEFRPRKIADFVGLEKPKKVLQNLLRNPRPCALLFVGEPGCGKTTIAQAFADELGAELHHVGSQQCQKETLAEISRMCEYAAFDYKTGEAKSWHVVLVDEADCASDAAQKYLLSKLDSTGRLDRTIWIFTANATDRLEERFISRCLRLDFGSYGAGSGIADLLARVWEVKAPGVPAPNFKRIACGNVRESLSKLEIELLAV